MRLFVNAFKALQTKILHHGKPYLQKNAIFHFIFKISSAEQFKKEHNFESVASEGCIRPDKYCETVGLETPMALAISVFVFPDCSISCFKFLLIISSKEFFIILLY